MATAKKTAVKAETKEKAPKAAAAAAPTATPPAEPPAPAPIPSTASPAVDSVQTDATSTDATTEDAAATAPAPKTVPKVEQPKVEEPKPFVDTAAAEPVKQDTPAAIQRLERARDLVELAKGEEATQVTEGIQSFKDTDRRTMKVVLVGNSLYKQEV